MRRLVVLAIVLGVTTPAAAQPDAGWARALRGDDGRLADRLIESAIALIACATEPPRCAEEPPPTPVLWAQAAFRLERATALRPDDADVRLLHAISAAQALGADASREDIERVIAVYDALRERAPDHAASQVATDLAVLRTRAGDMEGAAREYARADAMRGLGPTPYVYPLAMWEALVIQWHLTLRSEALYANWAEVTMLAGDAERAVDLYQRAMDTVPEASFSGALARWGLALARERMGAHQSAVEMACAAIDVGLPTEVASLEEERGATRARWGPFAALHDPGVFFEPRHEIRAYEALGHECLASRSASAEGRRMQLERARASWRFFLLEGGDEGRWAEPARAALSALERELSP